MPNGHLELIKKGRAFSARASQKKWLGHMTNTYLGIKITRFEFQRSDLQKN